MKTTLPHQIYQGHGTFKCIIASHGLFLMYHSQPWFNLNVPWPARVYNSLALPAPSHKVRVW